MSRDSLRYFGMRLAIPLLPGTCVDDARMLLDGIHERVNAEDPTDDYWLNLLGTASLRGHTNLVFGAYKIRSPHHDAISHLAAHGEPNVRLLASRVQELSPKKALKNCVDLTASAVRGGPWFWGAREEEINVGRSIEINVFEVMAQENRAWQHVGAVPRSCDDQIARVTKTLQDLETKHGNCDPRMWQWGPDKSLADVFAADAAVYQHRALKAQLAALQDSSGARLQ